MSSHYTYYDAIEVAEKKGNTPENNWPPYAFARQLAAETDHPITVTTILQHRTAGSDTATYKIQATLPSKDYEKILGNDATVTLATMDVTYTHKPGKEGHVWMYPRGDKAIPKQLVESTISEDGSLQPDRQNEMSEMIKLLDIKKIISERLKLGNQRKNRDLADRPR